jgi:hypothetical protein
MSNDPFIYVQFIRNVILVLPGTTEGMCFGTPAFYVNKKLLSRMKEDGETLVVHTPEREIWMQKDPETFFITDHYRNYPSMLIALNRVQPEALETLLKQAWLNRASKTQIKEYQRKD